MPNKRSQKKPGSKKNRGPAKPKRSRNFRRKPKTSKGSDAPHNKPSKFSNRSDTTNVDIDTTSAAQIKHWLKDSQALVDTPRSNFTLDNWQKKAIDHLLAGDSIIVDAPTSAGKTKIAEEFLAAKLDTPGFKVVYTAPVKSLSNDKLFELREKFGHNNVGISTGDYKENLSAPIVVATLESYRNAQLGTDDVPSPTMVVFDEYHYIGESSRGSAWEESIILTPPETQILMLSASVANATDFCGWLRSLKNRPCYLVSTPHRPVPLEHLIFNGRQWVVEKQLSKNWQRKLNGRTMRFPVAAEDIAQRLQPLFDADLAPFIIYAGRRLSVELGADAIAKALPLLPLARRQALEKTLQSVNEEYQSLAFIPQKLRSMIVSKGVAFHHSGLAPPARILIEKLLKAGELKVCVATMGLSLGINFAVRSGLISDYRRPDEQGFVNYSESEVLQMLGRAGRRGNDVVGYSIWPSLESYYKMAKAERQPCLSNFKIEPITLMGLIYRAFSPGRLEAFYRDSFGAFVIKQKNMNLIKIDRLKKSLGMDELPCRHPVLDYDDYLARRSKSHCQQCPIKKQCHKTLSPYRNSLLNQHYAHLLRIGCIDFNGELTSFGKTARYFPQNGGLLFAKKIIDGEFHADNLAKAAEFAGALALAGHKKPLAPESYRLPFDELAEEKELLRYYPERLFGDLYDYGKANDREGVLREWNPNGGFVIKSWLEVEHWKELEYRCAHERYGAGDLMNLIYRVATYLQSIAQLRAPAISDAAAELRLRLLREPLALAIKPAH